jgi:hypothetical protein
LEKIIREFQQIETMSDVLKQSLLGFNQHNPSLGQSRATFEVKLRLQPIVCGSNHEAVPESADSP